MLYVTCLDYRCGVFPWHPGLRIWGLAVVEKDPEGLLCQIGGHTGETRRSLWDPMNELTSPNCGESFVNDDKIVYKVL